MGSSQFRWWLDTIILSLWSGGVPWQESRTLNGYSQGLQERKKEGLGSSIPLRDTTHHNPGSPTGPHLLKFPSVQKRVTLGCAFLAQVVLGNSIQTIVQNMRIWWEFFSTPFYLSASRRCYLSEWCFPSKKDLSPEKPSQKLLWE